MIKLHHLQQRTQKSKNNRAGVQRLKKSDGKRANRLEHTVFLEGKKTTEEATLNKKNWSREKIIYCKYPCHWGLDHLVYSYSTLMSSYWSRRTVQGHRAFKTGLLDGLCNSVVNRVVIGMSALVCCGWVVFNLFQDYVSQQLLEVAVVKFGLRALCPHDFEDLLAFLTGTTTGSKLTVNQNYMSAYRRWTGPMLACCLWRKS